MISEIERVNIGGILMDDKVEDEVYRLLDELTTSGLTYEQLKKGLYVLNIGLREKMLRRKL